MPPKGGNAEERVARPSEDEATLHPMKPILNAFAVCAVLATASPAAAWGDLGHEVTALIAYRQGRLCPAVPADLHGSRLSGAERRLSGAGPERRGDAAREGGRSHGRDAQPRSGDTRIPLRFPDPLPNQLPELRPTDPHVVLRPLDAADPMAGLEAAIMRRDLVPTFWRQPVKAKKFLATNARSETVSTTSAFKDAPSSFERSGGVSIARAVEFCDPVVDRSEVTP